MSTNLFGTAARKGNGTPAREAVPERPMDAAWMVLEAANDLGDHATVEVCRRVIDANLNGMAPSPLDLHIIVEYFS